MRDASGAAGEDHHHGADGGGTGAARRRGVHGHDSAGASSGAFGGSHPQAMARAGNPGSRVAAAHGNPTDRQKDTEAGGRYQLPIFSSGYGCEVRQEERRKKKKEEELNLIFRISTWEIWKKKKKKKEKRSHVTRRQPLRI